MATKGQEFGNILMTRKDIENNYDFAVTQYLAVRRTAQRAYLFTPDIPVHADYNTTSL